MISRSAMIRLGAVGVIALVAWGVAFLPRGVVPGVVRLGDDFFYDGYYRARAAVSQQEGEVVVVTADEPAIAFMAKAMKTGWPWNRDEEWREIAEYLQACGAKAVVFDIHFSEMSAHGPDDDTLFARNMGKLKVPVVFGNFVGADGAWGPFEPPVKGAVFGATNVSDDKVYRRYKLMVMGKDSLALAAVKAAGETAKLATDGEMLLHFYGGHEAKKGETIFPFISAGAVFQEALDNETADVKKFNPRFKGKIVLLGASAVGTYDSKSTPLAPIYPGVEVQATAVANLLSGETVTPVGMGWRVITPLLCALVVAAGVIFPRMAAIKSLAPLVAGGVVVWVGVALFGGKQIAWMTPTESLLAVVVCTPLAFAWTYLAEDRQRRFMLRALSKVVSPAVAEQLAANPGKLQLGTVRTELTLIFTDLANFTDLAEKMDVETLGKVINRYLGEMSDQVFAQNGTLDKYIGDAVMCFWNAPIAQGDHAKRACRAALGMAKRERELMAEFDAVLPAGKHLFTRIGISTTPAAVGFVGSSHLFNYTALGDGVNLASRLEGANKIYGTRLLAAETAVAQTGGEFLFRKLDVLRVKGKKVPMAVYELIAAVGGEGDTPAARENARLYEAALLAYQKREWGEAEKFLLELSEKFGQDGPAKMLQERVAACRNDPPGTDWDGVHVAKDK